MMMTQTNKIEPIFPCVYDFEKNVTVVDRIDSDVASICLRSDGIKHIHTYNSIEVTLEDSKKILELSYKLGKGIAQPTLFTTQKFTIPTQEARDYLNSEERRKLTKADAFVLHSLPQKIIANFYVRVTKPQKPTKIFTNIKEAISWLKQFV